VHNGFDARGTCNAITIHTLKRTAMTMSWMKRNGGLANNLSVSVGLAMIGSSSALVRSKVPSTPSSCSTRTQLPRHRRCHSTHRHNTHRRTDAQVQTRRRTQTHKATPYRQRGRRATHATAIAHLAVTVVSSGAIHVVRLCLRLRRRRTLATRLGGRTLRALTVEQHIQQQSWTGDTHQLRHYAACYYLVSFLSSTLLHASQHFDSIP
jgi:hypothetical protein